MPAILRKSLTACEALAALPPTPRTKRRPPAARAPARRAAAFSFLTTSRLAMIWAASARNSSAKLRLLISAHLLVGLRNSSSHSIRLGNQFRKTVRAPPAQPIRRPREVPRKPPPGRERGFRQRLAHGKRPARNRYSACANCGSSCCRRQCGLLQTPRYWRPIVRRCGILSSVPTWSTEKIPVQPPHSRRPDRNRHTSQKNSHPGQEVRS